ncbi:MAG: DUF4411 domain-containing protein [Chloroflexi bacterium HGW-Chloroflexi-9]|nr:MAG: DUF4411 domain-containing protein [Chloroflexi bacterium HGW-Chloroflexi-9]
MTERCYSVDTSALMDGWIRYYPSANFPRLWSSVDALIEAGRFLISEEVLEELKVHDDSLKAWAVERQLRLVVPTDSTVAGEVQRVLAEHSRLVMAMGGRNRADPFVIAVARLQGATVVTGEVGGTQSRPKIPSVCNALGIPVLPFLGLIQAESWVFG